MRTIKYVPFYLVLENIAYPCASWDSAFALWYYYHLKSNSIKYSIQLIWPGQVSNFAISTSTSLTNSLFKIDFDYRLLDVVSGTDEADKIIKEILRELGRESINL